MVEMGGTRLLLIEKNQGQRKVGETVPLHCSLASKTTKARKPKHASRLHEPDRTPNWVNVEFASVPLHSTQGEGNSNQ